MNAGQFIEKEKLRANAYNLFSSLLCEPEPSLMQETAIFKNLENYLRKLLPETDIDFSLLYTQVASLSIQKFQVEYARLFIGPFKVPAPPYSSLYLGEDILMGDTTVWVKNFYRDTGLEFDTELRDLPDHAAVETEFIYYLIYNEFNNLDRGFTDEAKLFWDRQKTFTGQHYNLWIPKLCDKVIENTELDYFKIIFKYLKLLVTEVRQPDFPPITA